MFANLGNRKNSFSSVRTFIKKHASIQEALKDIEDDLKKGKIDEEERDEIRSMLKKKVRENWANALDHKSIMLKRRAIKINPAHWAGGSDESPRVSPYDFLDPSERATFKTASYVDTDYAPLDNVPISTKFQGVDIDPGSSEDKLTQQQLQEKIAKADLHIKGIAEHQQELEAITKRKEEDANIATEQALKKWLGPFKTVEQERKIELLEKQPDIIRAQTKEALKLKAIDIGASYAGMGARVALETGKSAVHAPIHVAGRIVSPTIHGAKRMLTAPARALGSATSGMKGAVGFAGQEAASVLHDFGSAANIAAHSFGSELARGVNRAFGSDKGFTREMSDPFLRSYHTQTAMRSPIGGFEMPTGIRRFQPSTWGGQLI